MEGTALTRATQHFERIARRILLCFFLAVTDAFGDRLLIDDHGGREHSLVHRPR